MNKTPFKILSIASLALALFTLLIMVIVPLFLFRAHDNTSWGMQAFIWLVYYSMFLIPSVFTLLIFRKQRTWAVLLALFAANIIILFWKGLVLTEMLIEKLF